MIVQSPIYNYIAWAVALGRIGGEQVTPGLVKFLPVAPVEVRSAAAEGCILCAERYLAEGNLDEAVEWYDLVRRSEASQQRILEATRGAILARQSAGVPLLVEQLQSSDEDHFALGLRVARELEGGEVTDALVAELGRAAPHRQVLLVLALAIVGENEKILSERRRRDDRGRKPDDHQHAGQPVGIARPRRGTPD